MLRETNHAFMRLYVLICLIVLVVYGVVVTVDSLVACVLTQYRIITVLASIAPAVAACAYTLP